MRHAEWKKLLTHPVVLKAREALRRVQEELSVNPLWKQNMSHLAIFPDSNRRNVLYFIVVDLAFVPPGQPLLTKQELVWEVIANADPDEVKAMVLAEIVKFNPTLAT